MDHQEESTERASLPQQEQPQKRRGRTQQQPQQQWQQRAPTGYPNPHIPTQQQPQSFGRRPYPGDMTAAVAGQPPAVQPPYPMQQQQPPPAHYSATAATAAYPYQAAAGVPMAYHPHHPQQQQQQHAAAHQMAIQQSYMQQQHMGAAAAAAPPMMDLQQQQPPQPQQPFVQPTVGRLPSDRPLVKLSVSLIDTYKQINKVYYEERDARRAARAAQKASQSSKGTNNNGWDDENYDYIVTSGEMFYGRYVIKERIGKGSFGQVVRAVDTETQKDVAIKIIKSKKPFLMQAKTEIELLTHLCEKDPEDQNNVVRLLTHFMFRNHQCLVFEMLSLNLYELLKNTQFGGVSLNLIRKFAKQILKALSFLARTDVDIIHCDLKPENILLRHPKRSGVKVIDFGSSCRSNRRMYSYIQSRFYRSPEVMLGLPYSVAIDVWSLGCILAEMHTGEPLFSGSDQFDQMQKIVKLLGMVPNHMIDRAGEQQRTQFFERIRTPPLGTEDWMIRQTNVSGASTTAKSSSGSSSTATTAASSQQPKTKVVPSSNPVESLTGIICAEPNKKKKLPSGEATETKRNYELFVDLIHKMLAFDPEDRIKPEDALNHAFIRTTQSDDPSQSSSPAAGSSTATRRSEASSTEGASRPRKDAVSGKRAAVPR